MDYNNKGPTRAVFEFQQKKNTNLAVKQISMITNISAKRKIDNSWKKEIFCSDFNSAYFWPNLYMKIGHSGLNTYCL